MNLKAIHFLFIAILLLMAFDSYANNGTSGRKKSSATCEQALMNIKIGFLEASNKQLQIIEKHSKIALQQMASELHPLQRPLFFKIIEKARGVGRGSFGAAGRTSSLMKVMLNVFLKQHPQGFITLVHEAQHAMDAVPGAWLMGSVFNSLNPNFVAKTESNAFAREYDLLRSIALDPEFDIEAALARPKSEDLQMNSYDSKETGWDDIDDVFTEDFKNNPGKYLSNPKSYKIIEQHLLKAADRNFRWRIQDALEDTKEEYIKNRLSDYEERVNRQRLAAVSIWTLGLITFSPQICSFFGL